MKSQASERIILGIDPGTNILGFGVIQITGNQMKLLDFGVLDMSKSDDAFQKLATIYTKTCELIDLHGATELSIEAPFFGKNVQSMLKLGRAQGTAIAAAVSKQLPVNEYSPKKIKQSITGKGSSTKEQVAQMLTRLLHTDFSDQKMDATDGIAAAVCHYFQQIPSEKNSTAKKTTRKSGSWEKFVQANPGRLKK